MLDNLRLENAATNDECGTGASPGTGSDLGHIQQELAHWRRLAERREERLRLAMDVGRLGT
jgi:hypothetical protein